MSITFMPSPSAYNTALDRFYRSQGLETDGTEGTFYSAEAKDGSLLVGGITLSRRYGITVLDYIAVLPEYRKQGIGGALVCMAVNKLRKDNVREVFLVTKAENFFSKHGAMWTNKNKMLLSECLSCPRYGNECRPILMKIEIS